MSCGARDRSSPCCPWSLAYRNAPFMPMLTRCQPHCRYHLRRCRCRRHRHRCCCCCWYCGCMPSCHRRAPSRKGVIAGDFMTGAGGPPTRGAVMGSVPGGSGGRGGGGGGGGGANALFGGGPRPLGFHAPTQPQYAAGAALGPPSALPHQFATAGDPMGVASAASLPAVPPTAPAASPAPITAGSFSSKYMDSSVEGSPAPAAAPAEATAAQTAASQASWDGGTIDGGGTNPFADGGTSF